MVENQTQNNEKTGWGKFWQRIVAPNAAITDVGRQRQARLFSTLLLVTSLLIIVRVIVGVISGSAYTDPSFPLLGIMVGLMIAAYFLSRTKYYVWGLVLGLVGLSALIHSIIIIRGDFSEARIESSSFWLFIPLIFGGMIFPWWGTLLWGVANITPLVVIPRVIPEITPAGYSTVLSLTIVVTALVMILNRSRNLQEQDRRNEILSVNRELADLSASLETRVQDATQNLELAADIGRGVSLVRDLDIMLKEAVELIGERFNMYYTQVYLVDIVQRSLTLRAGTGEVGTRLMQRGHRLAIDMGSINGIAVSERRAVIVEDTETSTVHRPNPLLPETRSEMAIPLIVGDQVVGVLDMQSGEPGALSEENVTAFEGLAGQLAIAIANADLFRQLDRSRHELEVQSRQASREGWSEFMDAIHQRERVGYSFDQKDVQPLEKPLAGIFDESVLVTPIQVAGEPVGVIQLEGQETWDQDDIEMVETVADQVAQQVESLRLLEQADRYRSDAQNALRRLTREGWESYQDQFGLAELGFAYKDDEIQSLEVKGEKTEDDFAYDIQVQDEPIGQFGIAGLDPLSEQDIELLTLVSEQLSAHIENLRLSQQTESALADTEEQAVRLAALNELSADLGQAENIDEIFGVAAKYLNKILPAERTSLTRLTEDGKNLEVFAIHGDSSVIPTGSVLPIEDTAIGTAVKEARVVLSDLTQSKYKDSDQLLKQGLKTTIAVPLVVTGAGIGTINFGSTNPNAFSPTDQDLALQASSLISTTIENLNLLDQTRLSEDRFRTIVEHAPEAIVVVNMETGLFIEPNENAEHLYNLSRDELLKVGPADMSPPVQPDGRPSGEAAMGYIQEALDGGAPIFEWMHTNSNGDEIPCEVRLVQMPDPIRQLVRASVVDISDRKAAAEALAKNAVELATVAEVSTTASTVLDPDKLLQSVVDLAKAQFGLYHAHIYLYDESWNMLMLAAGAGDVGRKMVAEDWTIPFDKKQSLVAQAARDRKGVIVNNVQAEPGFLPNPQLPDTRSEMAVPMIVADKVLGVLDVQSDIVY